jgi:hypothetical protein
LRICVWGIEVNNGALVAMSSAIIADKVSDFVVEGSIYESIGAVAVLVVVADVCVA